MCYKTKRIHVGLICIPWIHWVWKKNRTTSDSYSEALSDETEDCHWKNGRGFDFPAMKSVIFWDDDGDRKFLWRGAAPSYRPTRWLPRAPNLRKYVKLKELNLSQLHNASARACACLDCLCVALVHQPLKQDTSILSTRDVSRVFWLMCPGQKAVFTEIFNLLIVKDEKSIILHDFQTLEAILLLLFSAKTCRYKISYSATSYLSQKHWMGRQTKLHVNTNRD